MLPALSLTCAMGLDPATVWLNICGSNCSVTDFSAVLACAPNFRELSGLRAHDGRNVGSRRLFRSDAILAPEVGDCDILGPFGVDLVFDLRSATERTHAPNTYLASVGADLRAVDLLARIEDGQDHWHVLKEQPNAQGGDAAMHTVYAAFPQALHGQLAAVVEAILTSPGAVLVHCTAGKDRTGFLIAVLLSAIGVGSADILADYLKSAGRGNAQVRDSTRRLAVNRIGFELPEDALDRLLSVQESYLNAAMVRIEQDFGGIEGYFVSAGISEQQLAALKSRLLE